MNNYKYNLDYALTNSSFYQILKEENKKFHCIFINNKVFIYLFNDYNDDGSLSIYDIYIIKLKILNNHKYKLLIDHVGYQKFEEECEINDISLLKNNNEKRLFKQKK